MEINAGFIEKLLETLRHQHNADSEKILEPTRDLVEIVRRKGIQVYAVTDLSDDLKKRFRGSFAVETPDGGKAIVITKASIDLTAENSCVSYSQALEAVLRHELSHLAIAGDCELAAWHFEPSPSLPRDAIDRIKNFVLRGMVYQKDSKPEPPIWVKRFDELKSQVGYGSAWTATAHYREKFQAHELLDQLRLAGWGFDAAYEVSHGDLARGLWHRCVENRDFSLISTCNG